MHINIDITHDYRYQKTSNVAFSFKKEAILIVILIAPMNDKYLVSALSHTVTVHCSQKCHELVISQNRMQSDI